MKDLYLDCFSGIAGDMLVGALLDLGAPFEAVETGLSKLGVTGYTLSRRVVSRHAIAATKFDVELTGHHGPDPGAVETGARAPGHGHAGAASPDPDDDAEDDREHEHEDGGRRRGADHGHDHGDHGHGHEHGHSHGDHDHEHRHDHDHGHKHSHDHSHGHSHDHSHEHARGLREIRAIVSAADLPARVKGRAIAAFTLLAEAEARVHGSTPDEVHFHEVGAVDAVCDIVGAALALEALGVGRIFVGPLRTGSGFVHCAHGTMPVPAPGALNCLAGFDVRFEQGRGELITPTGACLVGALATPGAPAEFVVERVGYGAGTRDPADVPNVLRAVLGRAAPRGDEIVELSTNLDHLPPTQVAAAADAAFAAGALDVFVVPCTMKKGRPGHLVVALATDAAREAVEGALFRETGTLGIRRRRVERTVLERSFETVATAYGPIRVKLGRLGGRVTSAVPEHEDCRAAGARHGVAVADVSAAARAALGVTVPER